MDKNMNDAFWADQPPIAPTAGVPTAGVPTAAMQEEFTLLMSLALDGLLDEADEQRFQSYLAAYPPLSRQWQNWQRLDLELSTAPHVAPPLGFSQRVAARLEQRTLRHRRWRTTLYTAGGILLWVGLLAGGVAIGAYLLNLQATAMGETVHSVAWLSNFVAHWWATLQRVFYISLGAPQARYVGVVYALAAAVLLTAWIQLLRRTTYFDNLAA